MSRSDARWLQPDLLRSPSPRQHRHGLGLRVHPEGLGTAPRGDTPQQRVPTKVQTELCASLLPRRRRLLPQAGTSQVSQALMNLCSARRTLRWMRLGTCPQRCWGRPSSTSLPGDPAQRTRERSSRSRESARRKAETVRPLPFSTQRRGRPTRTNILTCWAREDGQQASPYEKKDGLSGSWRS